MAIPQTPERERTLVMAPIAVTRIHCPRKGCAFAANATTEGGAMRALAAHLVSVHIAEGKEQRA